MSTTPETPEIEDAPEASAAPLVEAARPEMDDAPPVLGSWRNIYITVLSVLAVLVVLFAIITKVYS